MYIVGITGPSGTGKTIAGQALNTPGTLLLNCDEIYSELLSSNTEMISEIATRFDGVLTNGSASIDKTKLGKIVFENPSALIDLTTITNKYIIFEAQRRIEKYRNQGGNMVIVDAAVTSIIEGIGKCNIVLCVLSPLEMRIKRIMERDGLTREGILSRINAQPPDNFYIEHSDYIINNTYENIQEFEDICVNTVLIDKWFCEHTDEMIADIGELVAINSVRGKREDGAPFGTASRQALSTAQKLLEKHGFVVDLFEDMVITASLGPNPPTLGILTHLDVVAAGEHWDTDPFKLTLRDGKIYGRGVMDNKGPAVVSMYAARCVRELFPNLGSAVQLIFGSGEETGFEDISSYMNKNDMPPNVFSPDAGFPVINVEKGRFMPVFGAKWDKDTELPRVISISGGVTANIVPNHAEAIIDGISRKDATVYCQKFSQKTGVTLSAEEYEKNTIKITAQGTASHASRPHLGNNAQTALLEMLASMPFASSRGFEHICTLVRLFPHGDYSGQAFGIAMQDDISGPTTLNFGVLRYDELEFSANFDARTAICADETNLLETTRDILSREGIEITYHELKHSHHTPEDTPFVQTLLRIYEQNTGKKGECLSMGGLTYVHDITGGVAFGCTRTEDDNNIHGPNEYFDIDELVSCAKIFTQVIVEMCGDGCKSGNECVSLL